MDCEQARSQGLPGSRHRLSRIPRESQCAGLGCRTSAKQASRPRRLAAEVARCRRWPADRRFRGSGSGLPGDRLRNRTAETGQRLRRFVLALFHPVEAGIHSVEAGMPSMPSRRTSILSRRASMPSRRALMASKRASISARRSRKAAACSARRPRKAIACSARKSRNASACCWAMNSRRALRLRQMATAKPANPTNRAPPVPRIVHASALMRRRSGGVGHRIQRITLAGRVERRLTLSVRGRLHATNEPTGRAPRMRAARGGWAW